MLKFLRLFSHLKTNFESLKLKGKSSALFLHHQGVQLQAWSCVGQKCSSTASASKNLKRQLELLVSPLNSLQCYLQMLWPLGSSLQLDSTQPGTREVITKPGIASFVL